MSHFLSANRFHLAACLLTLVCLLCPIILQGNCAQSQAVPATGAALMGMVRNSRSLPLAEATVSLQAKDSETLTLRTDRNGAYRFSAVRPGLHTLRVEMVGYATATMGPFILAEGESRTIDLTLELARPPEPQTSSDARPEFFEEPHFTVAGVTDTTSLGGHGSDTIVRNREALAKATASLSKLPAATATVVSNNGAREESLRESVELQPADFDANHQLGKLLVGEGRAGDALVYLERASRLKPDDFDNGYELALARAAVADYDGARSVLSALRKSGENKAEPHHLLGEVCEKLNNPLEAVREYQRAAELNPSEPYFFDWGSELLLHHAAEPAVQVFTKGTRLFPRSARMLAGLGASWYALGNYEQAAQRLCEASDLNPADPNPYLLMGKLQAAEPTPSEAIRERLERFVRLEPENALANYYYAVSLWKRRKSPEDAESFAKIKALLEKAAQLDVALGPAYLQLGILYAEQKDWPRALVAYQHAIAAGSELEEAHYRLAQAYRQVGETSKAQVELQTYQRISKEKAAETERQRHEVQQFVYQVRDSTTPANH